MPATAPTRLKVEFGSQGLASISYAGTTLVDSVKFPGDAWRLVDVNLRVPGGKSSHTWVPPELKREWDADRQLLTVTFQWGVLQTYYTILDDRLDISIIVTNTSNTDTIDGLNVYPMAMRFPKSPAGLDGGPVMTFTLGDIPVRVADWGTGAVAIANRDMSRPLYVGWMSTSETAATNRYEVRVGSSGYSTQPTSWPMIVRSIPPNGSDIFWVSLGYGVAGSNASELAPETFATIRNEVPLQLNWTDRRPIGALFPAGSAPETRGGTNPRGWFNQKALDVTTPNGLSLFRRQLLSYADFSIRNLKAMNAQGVIVWDIEGQEFIEATYVGDPRVATQMAPELEYMNVVDEFFKKFSDAGLRVGVTIRPQKLVFENRLPRQEMLPDPTQELSDKIAYAKKRWGATLFYIDSNESFDTNSIKNVAKAFPDVLLIPEHEIERTYAYAAPYGEVRGGYVSTPNSVRHLYPGAFSVVNVFDGDVAAAKPRLIEAIRQGDILLFQAWWNNPNNAIARSIYAAAAK